MAPMTRCMAGAGGTPTASMAAYYARRAAAGLIVTEATVVSSEALGYPGVPGCHTEKQEQGWHAIVDLVHEAGGRIFCQLWHAGRAAHSYFSDCQPIAPSPLQLEGSVPRMRRLQYQMPRAMESGDFARVTGDFVAAAARARRAGFDGVELHAANGYLLDQFLHHASNRRDDRWGGDAAAMSRFPLQVVDALLEELGAMPLGVRVSPTAHTNMEPDGRDRAVFDHFLRELGERQLAYVHLGLFDDSVFDPLLGSVPSRYLRGAYRGVCVGVGNYGPQQAERAVALGAFDLVAFGRAFIANPDLVERLRQAAPLASYEPGLLHRLY